MHTPFDMRAIQRGARLKRSPYFEATQSWGCRGYTVYNHMFLPIAYDDLAADDASGARAIVDDELLAERSSQPRAQQARERIDSAAGRERHDEAHGFRGPVAGLRRKGRRRSERNGDQDRTQSTYHFPSNCFPLPVQAYHWR